MSPKPIIENTLFYGDNLDILREYIPDESIDLTHKKLDNAVFAAFGLSNDMDDEEILGRLLALNLQRAAEQDAR